MNFAVGDYFVIGEGIINTATSEPIPSGVYKIIDMDSDSVTTLIDGKRVFFPFLLISEPEPEELLSYLVDGYADQLMAEMGAGIPSNEC